ncbi:MAG: DUF6916 family protein [Pyrinomonadaceae bacterium]
MDNTLQHETFLKYLNTKFHISLDDSNTLETELIKVGEHQLSPHQERFSIIFQGPLVPRLSQGTYSVNHDGMGAFNLFIVPIEQDSQSVRYEAVFNRLIKPTS